MTINSLQYHLTQGYIHHWLAAGPISSELPGEVCTEQDNEIHLRSYELDSGIDLPPVDAGSLGTLTEQEPLQTWHYYLCLQDHFVDFTGFHPTCAYLRAWAYAELEMSEEHAATLILTVIGPADLWVNEAHVLHAAPGSNGGLQQDQVPVIFQPGKNKILVRFEATARRSTSFKMALQVTDTGDVEPVIHLPTEIEADLLKKRVEVEEIIQAAYTDRYVYGYLDGDRYSRNEPITVNFAQGLKTSANITFRCQSFAGDIYNEGTTLCNSAAEVDLAVLFPLRSGPLHLAMLPVAEEYYIKKMRLERKDLFYVVRSGYSQKGYGSYQARCKEALEDAAARRNGSLFSEIAKMALRRWENDSDKLVTAAVQRAKQHQAGSVMDVLGILDIYLRIKSRKPALAVLKNEMESCLMNYRYSLEDAGSDCMDFTSESQQILFHTCEILAGQLFPERIFTPGGQLGAWHKARGESLASDWILARGRYGFAEWDSPESVEASLSALSFLVDFSKNDSLRDLASALMDKIFFSLILNSFRGVYGSSRGCSDTASLLSARLSATSGVSRLMWGVGNFNECVMGIVSLARCRNYALPDILRKIAKHPISAVWSRERHQDPAAGREVNKVMYRTADFMLSSAQDYYPGHPGDKEHIWQATLGPDALVYVNHPTSLREDDAHHPNLWRGNGVLPRVAQWGDVLIALYRLPEEDWLGYTHAYFPAKVFDEYQLKDGWAFARQGKGYLAITAAKGIEFINTGKTAFRELRSYASQNAWLCHMGQELLDGDFESFQQKILAMQVDFLPASVRLQSLRQDRIAFGWSEPLVVNDQEQLLKDFSHIESPYCNTGLPADQIEIIYQDRGIRLNFE